MVMHIGYGEKGRLLHKLRYVYTYQPLFSLLHWNEPNGSLELMDGPYYSQLARAPFLSGTVSRQGQTSPTDGLPAPEMGTGLRLRQPAQSYRFQDAAEHAAACQKAPSPKRPGLLVTLSTDLILLATNSPSQERQQI